VRRFSAANSPTISSSIDDAVVKDQLGSREGVFVVLVGKLEVPELDLHETGTGDGRIGRHERPR